ncbi:MAG: hypothetical protein QM817_39205 [Archangium sp.]
MKSLSATLPLTLAIGGLAAALSLVLPFEASSKTSWLIGALAAAFTGALVLTLKLLVAGPSSTGTMSGAAAMKSVLTAQMLSIFVRLIAVGLGAFLLKQNELSPIMFVFAFALVSLGQQFLEARALLARTPVKPVKSEVTP